MPDTLYEFISQAGVRRDGTNLDSPYYQDAVWTRWQRGKPRKMGGYQAMSQQVNGPVRSVFQDSRSGVNSTHLFSQWGVQRIQFDRYGSSNITEDRTPAGFTVDPTLNWSHDAMYSSTGGAYSAVIAASSPDVLDISNDVTGYTYYGNIATNDPLVQISDGSGPIRTSGGICVLQPFLFVYGSNGLIRNSNANDFSTATGWTTGGSNYANSNNVSGTKIVYGQAVRGGSNTPAGLFWALDSLIRVSFVGGTALWNYDTLASPTTILSKKCVVEADGKFFWIGQDRFLFYNGVVQELPNDMNLNDFFYNLNRQYANKVWGTKVPHYGEIWWFYPRGSNTECSNAVIYNYRENTWYDAVLQRSAGAPPKVFSYPIWAGPEDSSSSQLLTTGTKLVTSAATASGNAVLTFSAVSGITAGMVVSGAGIVYGTTVVSTTATTVTLNTNTTGVAISTPISFTTMTTAFTIGQTVTGGTSGATGTVVRALTTSVNVASITGTFVGGETITASGGATAVLQASPTAQTLVTQYQHEYGFDKVVGQTVSSITASFTSQNFGFAIGNPIGDAPKTVDVQTRLQRFEPDFNATGPLTLNVYTRSFAQDPVVVTNSYTMTANQNFQDMTDQGRICNLQIVSNSQGGFFEQGQVLIKLEPGDERSTT